MDVRWLLAALHLLPLGLGLGAVMWRAVSLRGPFDRVEVQRLFLADTLWGVAAVIWIVTGLMRAFGGYEKGTEYYLSNSLFLIKMALLILILLLEIWPMVTLIRWRIRLRSSALSESDTRVAGAMATISWIQTALVIAMIFAATGMARGFGMNML